MTYSMSILKNHMSLPVVVGVILVGLPYSIALAAQCIYGWPDEPGYKKYIEALKPRRIYCLAKAVLESLKYLQYGKLYFQSAGWYKNKENLRHCEKGIAFGRRGNRLDLYHSPNVNGSIDATVPLVVFVYGGAWGSGERSFYCLLARHMAEELNAVVICPEYCTYPKGNVLGMVQDIADCLVWTQESGSKYNFDRDNVVLIGHSAGAHLCALTTIFLVDEREELFIEACKQRNITKAIKGVIGLSGVYNIMDHYEHEQKRAVEYVSTMHKAMNGAKNFPYYSPTCALKQLRQDKLNKVPPFILLHGTSDGVVPFESSVRLSELLTSLSIAVSLYLLPGLNHIEIITDLMASDKRYYHLVFSCIKLEHRKLWGTHQPIKC